MDAARERGRLPILTGGGGMYFASLTDGLALIPDAGAAARAEARLLLKQIGPAALRARLAQEDPLTASRLHPTDSQRIARAWEVWRGTGTGLADWQTTNAQPAPWRFAAILLDPPRTELRAAIKVRFAAMVVAGALEEVRSLMTLGLNPDLPVMRAHGVRELAAHLRGEISLSEAARRFELLTGQYTKRQATWFRHHRLADAAHVHTIRARILMTTQLLKRNCPDLLAFIENLG